jgi:arylformamidase
MSAQQNEELISHFSSANWIDISVPLRSGMVTWPGDPEVRIERILDIEKGDEVNLSRLDMGAHTGTHMDAPLHFIRNGKSLDEMPLTATVGPARVIEIKDEESIKPDELISHQIERGERILFKTKNSTRDWINKAFVEDFVYISTEAGQFLVERGVQTVGIDYLSVGGYEKNGAEIHHTLLGAGIWIIEGLNLAKVQPGRYELICLPIKIVNSDGAPARAILRPLT